MVRVRTIQVRLTRRQYEHIRQARYSRAGFNLGMVPSCAGDVVGRLAG